MPTPTKYTFSIVAQTANAVVSDTLEEEIHSSSIVTSLQRIDTSGDVLDIWFNDTISVNDEITLQGLVEAHQGVPSGGTPAKVQLFADATTKVQTTGDGRLMQAPVSFEEGTFLYICGAGDDATNGRGEGQRFRLSRSTAGTTTVEWNFNDWIKAVGGTGFTSGGADGDELSFGMYAPATQVTQVTPGQGSCVLVDTGAGFNIIVPTAGGTHDIVSGTEIPVPASIGEGSFWSWSLPHYGKGSVSPVENGGYNLYDSAIPLARHVAHLQLLGSRYLSIDTNNVKPMLILPHWKFTATLTTNGTRDVSAVWEIKCVRMRSTQLG